MKAVQIEATFSVTEHEKDGEFTMKTKKSEKRIGNERPLMDSTIEIEAIRKHNWEKNAKAAMRYYSLRGQEHSMTEKFWVEDKSEEKAEKKEEKAVEKEEKKQENEAKAPEKKEIPDNKLNLTQLRAKYPEIKATSIAAFLEKLKAAKK